MFSVSWSGKQWVDNLSLNKDIFTFVENHKVLFCSYEIIRFKGESFLDDSMAYAFIDEYFKVLFIERKLDSMAEYMHSDYFDDDIGDPGVDHIESGRLYLKQLFERKPNIGVRVHSATIHDDVITAYLEWYNDISDSSSLWLKGVGLFVMKSGKILKRHTFIYQNNG